MFLKPLSTTSQHLPRSRAVRRSILYGGSILVLATILWTVTPSTPPSTLPDAPATPAKGNDYSLITPNLILVYLLLAAGAGVALYVRKKRPSLAMQGTHLRVIETLSLSPTHQIQLVSVGNGERLLLGLSPNDVRVLKTYPASSFEDAMEQASASVSPSNRPVV